MLGVHLLNVERILVIPHTRCAMASNTEDELREQVGASAGVDATWQPFGVVDRPDRPRSTRTSPGSAPTR